MNQSDCYRHPLVDVNCVANEVISCELVKLQTSDVQFKNVSGLESASLSNCLIHDPIATFSHRNTILVTNLMEDDCLFASEFSCLDSLSCKGMNSSCASNFELSLKNASAMSCVGKSRKSTLLEKKDSMIKIHSLFYFMNSIKNIGLDEDCGNYPFIDMDLSLLKKDDPLVEEEFDLLDYLRNPTKDYSYNVGIDSDSLYDSPPLFGEDKNELLDSCGLLNYDILDSSGGSCHDENVCLLKEDNTCLEHDTPLNCSNLNLLLNFDESKSELENEGIIDEFILSETFLFDLFALGENSILKYEKCIILGICCVKSCWKILHVWMLAS
ncbi:uncharacterized protein LOC132628275 [Lycium barbarum]|uniref:uncharacterized protein LOC132628275 n=1 Tax=Lycium barbarum TaxID=112863 RepID=UPI00293E2AFD|nr:uncharacterized protein LOC132628275 [Lycium barbarum]XP_060200044.1 uncharacterized protein LOC132628275 [Lycium barbarum]XP_060200045.1 uncharacterized protein LOC132628275 [Lycium barbarum]